MMARKKKAAESGEQPSFEDAFAKLEEIVRLLEDGQLGLSESLARYEDGVKYLKHCHQALEQAERKIALLTGLDSDGNPLIESFDEADQTLEEKQSSRSRRRSQGGRRARDGEDGEADNDNNDIDTQRGLF
jgi:exodeoxyribonuclease VII small subunit